MYSDTRTGMLLVLAHLGAILGALLLLLVHVALGARLRRLIGAREAEDPCARWPIDAALGAGALAILFLAVGVVGVLRPVVVLAVAAALALLSGRELLAAAGALVRALPARGDALAARVAVVLLFTLLVAGALGPSAEWDSITYHLRIPLQFLEAGRIALPEDSFHVALVGGSHLATLPLLAAGILVGPALMQVAALALTIMATAALARAAGASRGGGWLAAAVVLGSPMFVLVAITARVDVALVLALVAAHLALLAAADEPRTLLVGSLLVASLLVGSAMAIKPQAGAYALALVPLGWRAARGMRPALGAALIAALVSLPWYLKNLWLAGAPLYPRGAPGFFEPWIARLYGTQVRPDSVDASVLHALPDARVSFNVLDAFFDPGALTIEGEGVFYGLSPLLLLVPLVLIAWRTRSRATGVGLVGVAYAALVVVPYGQINLRYLMPAVPALAVAAVIGVESLAARFGARLSGELRRVLGVVLIVAAILPLTGALRQRFFAGDQVLLRHAAGLVSARDAWRRHPDFTARGFAPTVDNVRRLVPPDGRILMLWEARALPFEREVLADIMLTNWSYLAQSPAIASCLAGTGITHLLVGSGAVEYYVERGADPRAFLLDRFAPFRNRCLEGHTAVGPGFDLFVVRQPAP